MDALQQMEMDYIADSRSEFAFDRFRNDYPDLRIDESGTSVPKKKNYAEIRAKALDEVYSEAYSNLRKANFHDSSKSDEDSQIYNAKSLSCLENAIPKLDPKDYAPARFMFLKKHPDDAISIGRIEEYIGKLGFDPKPISAAIVSYCSRKGKEESYRSFLFHLSNRLEVANKDANRDLPMTKDLIGRLKSLEELKK
jgi:hypothetical protein